MTHLGLSRIPQRMDSPGRVRWSTKRDRLDWMGRARAGRSAEIPGSGGSGAASSAIIAGGRCGTGTVPDAADPVPTMDRRPHKVRQPQQAEHHHWAYRDGPAGKNR